MTYYRAPQNNIPDSAASQNQAGEKFGYFPAFVKVQDKKVVILGGGDVAAGKLRLLLRTHANITVIAAELCDDIARMYDTGQITWERQPFVDTMINGAVLVFDAADNPCLTKRVEKAAKRRNILLNVVDKTPHCDFIVPAILDRAPVMITISTGACAPALARILRQRLETVFPASLSHIARIAREARQTVATHLGDTLSRQRFWTRFFQNVLQADFAEKITMHNLLADLHQFTPQSSTTTIPTGQLFKTSVSVNNAYDIPHGIARHIETSDIIFHDTAISPEILALARRDAALVSVDDMPQTAGEPSEDQTALYRRTRFFTAQGLNVMWLSLHHQRTQHSATR
ncbi:siroheme synthase [Thalassospira profundimaris]|uniref:siroheme synthase n=1 Tax=Thalassospira profundimaris TaxID=502049 RepID=UPI000DEDD1AC|nr:siroheme synthase [Thalassospira profundimaris]